MNIKNNKTIRKAFELLDEREYQEMLKNAPPVEPNEERDKAILEKCLAIIEQNDRKK